jgi:spore maturation protein CgeB
MKELFTKLAEFRPDFILTSNYAGMDELGIFARFFADARIPYVSWFTDTPRMILFERVVYPSHFAVAATWERAYIPHFKKLGFEHVHFMPHATDPALFNGEPVEKWLRPASFVGDSMTIHAEEAWEVLEDYPEVTEALRRAFKEGRVTRDNFAVGAGAILGEELVDSCAAKERRHLELCLVYEATRRMRRRMVEAVKPLGVEARGDVHWRKIVERAGGPVGYFDDLAPYYRNTAVNLNVTSLQMRSAVNQRVFDCPAAGGFLLTDAQGDLDEFFDPETETATYSSYEELADKADYYLKNPGERVETVRNAQRRIFAHHTHAHRLEALAAYLKGLYG